MKTALETARDALIVIESIASGSTTANSLPNLARIAGDALRAVDHGVWSYNIASWQERCNWSSSKPAVQLMHQAMKEEIAELRAELTSRAQRTPIGNKTADAATVPNVLSFEAERVKFEGWARADLNMPDDMPFNWDSDWSKASWEAWTAAKVCARLDAPSHLPAREQQPSVGAQAGEDANNLSVMLWLLRRLPRAYANPPNVVGPILRLAKRTGTDISDCLAERAAAPAHPGEQEGSK